MLQLTERITGGVAWAHLRLLFWLSLLPFSTAWMDRSHFSRVPVMVFGIDLLGAAIAYHVLQRTIVHGQAAHAPLARAPGRDLKGRCRRPSTSRGSSRRARLDGWIGSRRRSSWVAVVWLAPDRRIERVLEQERGAGA